MAAGYNNSDTCCTSGHCAGNPPNCQCDLECYERGDCCDDISDACTEGKGIIAMHVPTECILHLWFNIQVYL